LNNRGFNSLRSCRILAKAKTWSIEGIYDAKLATATARLLSI
jgi:hypothetical protein